MCIDISIDIRVYVLNLCFDENFIFDSDCEIFFRLLIMDLEVNMNFILIL